MQKINTLISVKTVFAPFKRLGLCLVVTEPLYFQQVVSGGVQENPLFPLARQPDCLQSRLLVLRNLENHAQFQVRRRCWIVCYFLRSATSVMLTRCLFIKRLSAAGRPRVHALPAGPPPQGASVWPQWNIAPCVSTGWRQTVDHRGKKLHVSACWPPLHTNWSVRVCFSFVTFNPAVSTFTEYDPPNNKDFLNPTVGNLSK